MTPLLFKQSPCLIPRHPQVSRQNIPHGCNLPCPARLSHSVPSDTPVGSSFFTARTWNSAQALCEARGTDAKRTELSLSCPSGPHTSAAVSFFLAAPSHYGFRWSLNQLQPLSVLSLRWVLLLSLEHTQPWAVVAFFF